MPNTVATGSPDTAASAAGNPAPSKPWTAAPLWVASAAPATSAPIPNTAASPAPSAVSIRPWPMSRPVMPLSADADCWKNTIHGVTVAPIVEAINNSSVVGAPVGSGRNRSDATSAPGSGLTPTAATRNSPLNTARPSTTRSHRQ